MARAGEKLTLLDEKEVELDETTLVIADDSQALAMAGVMGGLSSSVTSATSSIFLECAYFSPLAIAGKARSYGMHTDASHRYERGVDWALQERAIERATEILVGIVGGKVGPITSATGTLPERRQISLSLGNVKRLLGVEVPRAECLDILQRLGFELVDDSGETLLYSVPSFRFDCAIEADLIEEIARVFGYNNLPKTPTLGRQALAKNSEQQLPLSTLKHRLVAAGFQEVINYSFIDPVLAENLCPLQKPVSLQNPLSAEMSVMRPSILPGLVTTLEYNLNRQRDRVRLFETGLVFESCDGEIQQSRKIGGLIYGSSHPVSWAQTKTGVDFFDLKGIVESLVDLGLGLGAVEFKPANHPSLHTGQCAQLVQDGRTIGVLGALHPRLQRHFGFAQAPYLFELDAEPLLAKSLAKAQALSKFPAVTRDLAVLVNKGVSSGEIERCVRQEACDVLVDLTLFDVYEGENLGADKKSIALSLTLQHPSRTLSDEETSEIITNCINALAAKFDAELRD
jgi:phenylalanyl-tRNA synthetase beta chain